MKTIPIRPHKLGLSVIVDDNDYDWLMQYSWERAIHGVVRQRKGDGKKIFIHRQILNAPTGLEVDHINSNVLDNRRANLRLATRSENMRNRNKQSNNTSGYKGVHPVKNRELWVAHLRLDGKDVFRKYFKNKEDAARAYDQAAIKYHGEFARLNFPDAYEQARQASDDTAAIMKALEVTP